MRTIDQLRDIENFIDSEVAQGRTLAEIREDVSCQIFLTELHDGFYPDHDMEFFVEAGVAFLGTERTSR